MTGSGKTGLCIDLLEEAAIDGIPALAIDPKGDLGNLLLTFPDLSPAEFRPWIDEDEARRNGKTPEEWAASQAETWRRGLESWGQSGERIKRLRAAVDVAIYTPGSQSGLPLSIVKSFAAPPPDFIEESDLMRERVATTATSLLGLLGIDADPIKSREHILLSTIIDACWRQGQDLDLAQAHPADPDAARAAHRRARARSVLPVRQALRAGDGREQPAGGARLQRLDGRRGARHPAAALHT